jgi:hypothetical protein
MVVNTEESPMDRIQHNGVRPGRGRPKTNRDNISVKMDRTLAAKAQCLARLKGITLAEFISESVRSKVERDFTKACREGADS